MEFGMARPSGTKKEDEQDMAADEAIAADARALSAQLQAMRERLFPPASQKTLRSFTSGEASRLVGVSDGYLRQLSLAGEGPQPAVGSGGRRYYSLADIDALRNFLAEQALAKGNDAKARSYVRRRDPGRGEHLQVISVTNFKGGSGKTTTAVHLAQHLAMTGHRVLAVDLDPQASLSSIFGYQPELDLSGNDTLYGAIRYDADIRPLSDIIRKTYFHNLDLVPGNLELQEFEHATPRALAMRQAGDAEGLFFARVQAALQSVGDAYDVVVLPDAVGTLRLDLGAGDGASADARRRLDEPVPVHDLGPAQCRARGRRHAQFRFHALSRHPLRAA
jgi:chromosome partitioning protein